MELPYCTPTLMARRKATPWIGVMAKVLVRRARTPAHLLAARRLLDDPKAAWRVVGGLGLAGFVALWELASLLGAPAPAPSAVAADLADAAGHGGYWNSWLLSFERVFWGFVFGLALGVPLGLAMATSRTVKRFAFPAFEILRPSAQRPVSDW